MTTRSEERQENPGKKSRVRLYLFSIALVPALLVIVFLVQPRNKPVFKTRPYKDGVEIIGCEGVLGRNLVIPEKIDGKPVRRIGNEAFYNRRSLQNATFPESLQTIGENAFSYCVSLTDVSFSRGLQRIEGGAFLGCKSLKRVELPAGLQSIGDGAFMRCESLTEATFPESLQTIGYGAFLGCRMLSEAVFSEGLRTIRDDAFSGCSLTTVRFPSSVEEIGGGWDCADFEISENHARFRVIDGVLFDKDAKVLIAYPAKKIGESYDVPEGVELIGHKAFSHCVSLGNVAFPEGLQTIGDFAFRGCSLLTEATFPESLQTIGDFAFHLCESLTEATFREGLHTIGDSAFSGCNLDVVKLPSTLKTIGADWECSGFEIPENNAHFRTIDGVLFDKEAKVLIVYPAKKAGESYDVPEGVESIGDEAFSHCVSLGSVTLPEGLQTIGNWAFNRCDSLTDVAFPESLRSIGIEAFPLHVKFTAPEGSRAAEWIRARR